MGFKTTFGPKGPVITKTSGDDEVVFASLQKQSITVVSESGNATVTSAILFRPMDAAGVTGTLPGISDALVGAEYMVLKNSGSNPLMLSGTNPIVGHPFTAVGLHTCVVSESAGKYVCLAISGSTGYQWFVHGSHY